MRDPYEIPGVFILGKDPVVIDGIRFVGLGGSPPGIFPDLSVAFPGNPYSTPEACDDAIASLLEPQMTDAQSVLLTHFPPYDKGFFTYRTQPVAAGNRALQTFIEKYSANLITTISGHTHIQVFNRSYYRTSAINPGSVLNTQYAVLTLDCSGLIVLKNAELKSL